MQTVTSCSRKRMNSAFRLSASFSLLLTRINSIQELHLALGIYHSVDYKLELSPSFYYYTRKTYVVVYERVTCRNCRLNPRTTPPDFIYLFWSLTRN